MKLLMSKIEKCSGTIIIQHQRSLDTNIIYHCVSDWSLVSDIFPPCFSGPNFFRNNSGSSTWYSPLNDLVDLCPGVEGLLNLKLTCSIHIFLIFYAPPNSTQIIKCPNDWDNYGNFLSKCLVFFETWQYNSNIFLFHIFLWSTLATYFTELQSPIIFIFKAMND